MSPTSLAVTFGLTAALANVAGGLLVMGRPFDDQRTLKAAIAAGSGFMLAAAMLKMIPLAISRLPEWGPPLLLSGYLIVHLFEHTLVPHFHYGGETHADEVTGTSMAYAALGGLLMHTYFDGVCIASGFHISPSLGFLLFASVLLHKLPEGATISSLMLFAGVGRRGALMAAVVLGLATLAGVLSMSLWMTEHVGAAMAISAGVMIYVSASDLIPIVNREKGLRMTLLVFGGVLLFKVTEALLEALGL